MSSSRDFQVVSRSPKRRVTGRPRCEPPQREASRVLEIVFDERPYHDRRIDEIAATYKAIFQQESVMVVRMPANVCF
jgi:hypothetical protein